MLNKRIVVFDGVCNLCNKSVQFIIKHDPQVTFYFSAFQSFNEETLLKNFNFSIGKNESLILIDQGQLFDKSTAALRIAKRLNGLWPIFYLFIIIPKPIRDFFYDLVAKNRYAIFGKKESCMVPNPADQKRFLL